MSDGTFGTTDKAEAMDDEVAQIIETSTFDTLGQLRWRNPDLDFRSGRQLLASLERKPDQCRACGAHLWPTINAR